jgi:hypothetical protein
MKRVCLLMIGSVLILSFTDPVFAKNLVLHGVPLVQTKSSMEDSINITLDNVQKKNHQVIITKEGDQYFWETRDHKKLLRTAEGEFDLFIDPKGGGYIKITKSNGKFIYMEHLSQGLKTFTYWGIADLYEP